MSKHDYNLVNNTDFDVMLMDSLPELAPDDVVKGITPWRQSMNNILMGLAMSAITLNFWCLNYILPTIGIIMTLLGFRTLRRENVWFKVCYILTAVRMAYFLPALIINATIYQSEINKLSFFIAMTYVNLVIIFILLFSFWKAIRAAQRKIELPPHAGGIIAMIIWYAVIVLLALSGVAAGFIGIIIVIAYIFIIRSLFKTSKELDEAGYAIQASKVKISDGLLAGIIAVILVVGIIGGYTLFSKYPMEWTVQSKSEHNGVSEIKVQLAKLGFPEEILEDLTAEDIKACEGAVRVVVDVNDHAVNDGYRVKTQNEEGIYITTEYEVEELRITGVAVRLPGEAEKWRIFHHFLFVTNPGFCGTEAVWLWSAYNSTGWEKGNDITGRVLYTKDDEDYISPYYSLASETYTSNNFFFGEHTSTDVFGTFSMPEDGEAHRGYVSYVIEESEEGWLIDAWINFVHQKSILNYPAITAKESQKIELGDTNVFELVQDALQFDPWE